MPVDFQFGVVKERLHLARVQPARRFGLLAGPVHEVGADAMQHPDTFRSLSAQPFAQRGLVSALLQAQQVHEHPVFAQALDVGERGTAAGKGEEQL